MKKAWPSVPGVACWTPTASIASVPKPIIYKKEINECISSFSGRHQTTSYYVVIDNKKTKRNTSSFVRFFSYKSFLSATNDDVVLIPFGMDLLIQIIKNAFNRLEKFYFRYKLTTEMTLKPKTNPLIILNRTPMISFNDGLA